MKQRLRALGLLSPSVRRRLAKAMSVATAAAVVVAAFAIINLKEAPGVQAAGGWLSGAGGDQIMNGKFAAWRGSPVTIAATWVDNDSAAAQMYGPCVEYGGWTGSLDLAVGGFDSGGSWAQAASGAYDAKWTAAMQKLYSCWGSKKTIFIRPFHEFNSGYPWGVNNASDAANFKLAFARYSNIIKAQLKDKGKDARVEICPNSDTTKGYGVGAVWPGDQYVDVVGVDYYTGYPPIKTQSDWDSNVNKTGNGGDPKFPGSYLAFAKSHGKPLSFPEWGIRMDTGGDTPAYIKAMHDFFAANAGSGAGQVVAETYFDIGGNFAVYDGTKAPQSSAMYKSLNWGNGGLTGGGSTPTAVPMTPTPTPGTNPCSKLKNAKADINGDCKVNINDLSILLASWTP